MKKQSKEERPPQEVYKYGSNPAQYYSYSSAQNLRPYNSNKESDSPSKVEPANRNSRKPEFIKNLGRGNERGQGQGKESPQKVKVGKSKEMRETLKSEASEYQKLNDKLNYLQGKISELSSNIDRKREEKWAFLEGEKRERIRRFEQSKLTDPPNPNTNTNVSDSLKRFVTQVNEGKDYLAPSFNPYSPRNNIYYVSEILKFHKDDRSLAREHVTMSAQYIRVFESRRVPTQEEAEKRGVKLARRQGNMERKTIIFDLDETLIHCNDSTQAPHDVKIQIKFPTGEEIEAGINIRPYAVELLRALAKNFEIVVFTASHSCYANVVLDYLDPNNEYVHHRLYREHCYVTADGVYVKDLRILNRELGQVVLVDNAAYSYAFQLDNAIPILPYYKGKNDFELKALQTYLENLIFQKDVREVNRKTFKLHRYREFDDIDNLVRSLYGEFA